MKHLSDTILQIVSVTLILFSCTRENNQPTPSVLKGKVKTVYYTDTTNNDTTYRYHLYYDATGFLTTVKDDSINIFRFTKLNDTTLQTTVHFPNEEEFTRYVYMNGNRITSIVTSTHFDSATWGIDTTIYGDLVKTIYSISHLDSVYDFTPSPYLILGINKSDYKFYDFIFDANNCISCNISWKNTPIYGAPYFESGSNNRAYTDIINDNLVPDQIVAEGYTSSNHLFAYFLGINGYFVLPPNKNLILSTTASNLYTISFDYTITNGKVTSYKISSGPFVRHIEYYE